MRKEFKGFNFVRFVCSDGGPVLNLRMDNELTRTPGLKPDMLQGVISYREFDLLGKELGRTGNVEMWFKSRPGSIDKDGNENYPEVLLSNWKIVDIEAMRPAKPWSQKAIRFTEYRLYITDLRERFVHPRGGYLDHGEINKEPFDPATGLDANGNILRNTKEVVDLVTEAMGLGKIAPTLLTKIPPPMNIEWRGNHAPSVLEKLLDELQCTFVVRQDGECQIWRIGDGSDNEVPQVNAIEFGGLDMPEIDRRGKIVLFSSFPTPVQNEQSVENVSQGPYKGWEYVAPDVDGSWKPYHEHSLLKIGYPYSSYWAAMGAIPVKYKDTVEPFLFRAIRPDPAVYGPVTIQSRKVGSKMEYGIKVRGQIPIAKNGVFENTEEYTEIRVSYLMNDGRVAVVDKPLVRLSQSPGGWNPENLVPLVWYRLQGSFTGTLNFIDKDRVWRDAYFLCGFKQELGKIVKLTQAEVTLAKEGTGSDRLIVSRPTLRLQCIDGVEQNRAALEAECEAIAARFVSRSGQKPKCHILRGFAGINHNGVISEISYTQLPPTTTVKTLTWWMPHAHYVFQKSGSEPSSSIAGGPRSDGGNQAYPSQAAESSRRSYIGASGNTQSTTPVMPAPAPLTYEGWFIVDLVKDGGDDGTLTTIPTYTYAMSMDGLSLATKAVPEEMRIAGSHAPATRGIAYRKFGVVNLLIAFEKPAITSCATEGGGA